MRSLTSLLFAAPVLALSLAASSDAAACGACFHGEMENTQVTGHKMIFSVSQAQTTLWDQFDYMGDPTSFAWVLPVKGMVQVGLSSDALFENLLQQTGVQVAPPPINCPSPPPCFFEGAGASSSSGGTDNDAGGVTVIAQSVVGPYETVTLHSSDPTALTTWLTMHSYVIPADIAPIIGAYVNEGFDFLALRLLPGMGVTSMKPVRVTSPGATLSLPLRMVAAGVGVTTPITLWIFGEGRYEPTNFPTFVINESQLVWDFASNSSNYAALRQAGFDASMGRGWLLEGSGMYSTYALSGPLQNLAMYDPLNSGYADAMGMGAVAGVTDDLDTLFQGITPSALWLTRIHAELPRAALATDLALGAATSQAPISANLTAKKGINIPACPVYGACPGTGGAGGAGGAGGTNAAGGAGTGGAPGGGGGCAVGGESDRGAAAGVLALSLGLALGRRRRRAAKR